jgi:hypothetical protein
MEKRIKIQMAVISAQTWYLVTEVHLEIHVSAGY